jgi:hypothetical protein
MEAVCFSDALVSAYKSTWRHSPGNHHRHLLCREDLPVAEMKELLLKGMQSKAQNC